MDDYQRRGIALDEAVAILDDWAIGGARVTRPELEEVRLDATAEIPSDYDEEQVARMNNQVLDLMQGMGL